MALHAVAAADDEHCVVEHRQRALHLGGEIDVARRVKQRELLIARKQHCLLGKDRDAALALLRVSVEKSVRMVDAAQTPKRAGGIEKRLGERRFPGVHVRKNADAQRGHFRI